MPERKYTTEEEVLTWGAKAIGVPLKEIDKTDRINKGKGAVGSVIEESWFGYSVNSESVADFPEAGVELKVTPYVKTSKGIRAKERLVCNIINYMEEYKNTFETSSFWKKCKRILIMSYEHRYDVPKSEFMIDKAILFSFPEEDLVIVEKDWEKIIKKIKQGLAHEISERDTLYLGACTKGTNSETMREQPFSKEFAKQRAYSLKQSYMTSVLHRFIFGDEENEHIIKDISELRKIDLIDHIKNKLSGYIGKSQIDLKRELNIDRSPKSLNRMIVSKILDVSDIDKSDEFQKANIKVKTIRVEANGRGIEQSMSFPAFDFIEIINKEWEDSEVYQQFVEQKYLFVIFQKDDEYNLDKKNKEYTESHLFLRSVMIWQLPEEDEQEIKDVWERTVRTLRKGVELIPIKKGNTIYVENDLPKINDNRIAHIRPHSARASYRFGDISIGKIGDANKLPDGRMMTKQCFWFNNSYILEQIKEVIDDKKKEENIS